MDVASLAEECRTSTGREGASSAGQGWRRVVGEPMLPRCSRSSGSPSENVTVEGIHPVQIESIGKIDWGDLPSNGIKSPSKRTRREA